MPAYTRSMSKEDSDKLKERKEMIRKADDLISNLIMRKNEVTRLLEGEMARAELGTIAIKLGSLSSDGTGNISTNSVLNAQRSAAEQVLQQFSEELVAIRTKVTLILSSLNVPEDSMFIQDPGTAPTPAMKFITIIQVIQSMSEWSSDIMDTWISYHVTRAQLKAKIGLQMLMSNQDFAETDDMCQAFVLWDCKMAKEMRTMLNTLLYNYITLEDIVLEATGNVAETPRPPSYSGLYI